MRFENLGGAVSLVRGFLSKPLAPSRKAETFCKKYLTNKEINKFLKRVELNEDIVKITVYSPDDSIYAKIIGPVSSWEEKDGGQIEFTSVKIIEHMVGVEGKVSVIPSPEVRARGYLLEKKYITSIGFGTRRLFLF